MQLRFLILISILVFLACNKDSSYSGRNPYGTRTISESQKSLQGIFKKILNDTDNFGTNGSSLDAFIIESTSCKSNDSINCDSLRFNYHNLSFHVNTGDTIKMKNDRIEIINFGASNQFHIFELNHGTPEDFPYMEFEYVKNNSSISCCYFSTVIDIDTIEQIIEFSLPEGNIKMYGIN